MDALIIVRIIAAAFIVLGFVFVLRPDILKKLLQFVARGRMLYVVGAIRICVGALFIWVGGRLHAIVLGVVGAAVIAIGVLSLVVKLETQRGMIGWLTSGSETTRRVVGVIAAVVGTLILVETYVRW